MRLFADHCFFAAGTKFLRECGHDIIRASEIGLERASDEEIVAFRKKQDRIVVTLDNDFTSLYRFPLGTHKGIVVFKINPFAPASLLHILKSLTDRKMFTGFENVLAIVKKDRLRIIHPGNSKSVSE